MDYPITTQTVQTASLKVTLMMITTVGLIQLKSSAKQTRVINLIRQRTLLMTTISVWRPLSAPATQAMSHLVMACVSYRFSFSSCCFSSWSFIESEKFLLDRNQSSLMLNRNSRAVKVHRVTHSCLNLRSQSSMVNRWCPRNSSPLPT